MSIMGMPPCKVKKKVYLLLISTEDPIYGWINIFFGFVRNNGKICITIQHSRYI